MSKMKRYWMILAALGAAALSLHITFLTTRLAKPEQRLSSRIAIKCDFSKRVPIISLTLAIFSISIMPSNAAKLPPKVQSAINEQIKSCGEKVKFEKGFLTRPDVNGDGIDDFILDYSHFVCGSDPFSKCGSGLFDPGFRFGKFAKVLDDVVRDFKFERVRGRPAMLFALHGSACGKLERRMLS